MFSRPLLLNGFMASGKSTVGRLVAAQTGHRFVDLDQHLEEQTGLRIAEIFAQRGEPEFRRLEATALDELLARPEPVVVALGGGALLARHRRLRALDCAVLITLVSSVEHTLRRAAAEAGQRPLLAGSDARARVEELLELRGPAYAESHARIDTTGRTPAELARAVIEIWERDPIGVAAGEQSYAVQIGDHITPSEVAECARGASRIVLVSDDNVARLHAEPLVAALRAIAPVETVTLPPGEVHKTLRSAELIWQCASAFGADRSSVFVGLGGGVVTDVAGFAAAGWMRGVSWLALPTTLLSMVDASVGGKTAVDLGQAKNCVGAFWQPKAVFCDVSYCATEPARGLTALSEVVKTALIGDAPLLDYLEQNAGRVLAREASVLEHLVRRSVRVKARVVSEDARESGFRAALNLGHTLGHALESVAGFERLSHGEAISLGLVAALRLGQRLGITPLSLVQRVTALLERLRLPTDLAAEPLEAAVELVGLDKKRKGNRVKFVFVREAGQIEFAPLELDEIKRRATELKAS